jgi:hypothetical protein
MFIGGVGDALSVEIVTSAVEEKRASRTSKVGVG